MNVAAFLNHNSYAIAAAIVLGVVGWGLVSRGLTVRRAALFAALGVLLAAPPLYLRAASGQLASLGELDTALASGRPTLLEVYSDL